LLLENEGRLNHRALVGEVRVWIAFVCAGLASVEAVAFLDRFLHRRGGTVSDGTVELFDAIALVLLGITQVSLRIRARRNATLLLALLCGLAPGVVFAIFELALAYLR
jgi:hypothetical protein